MLDLHLLGNFKYGIYGKYRYVIEVYFFDHIRGIFHDIIRQEQHTNKIFQYDIANILLDRKNTIPVLGLIG